MTYAYHAGMPCDPPTVDEEPWDLTEGATAASGRWLTALVVVLVLLGLVGVAVWVAK